MIEMMAVAAPAPEYLTSMTSEVYQADGSPDVLVSRAAACAAQFMASGQQGGELIVTSDPAQGVLVVNNRLDYRDGLMTWPLRSRVTFEARDGRFRILHASIERLNTGYGGWQGVGKWRGSGWQKAEEALSGVTARLAACVINRSGPADAW